MAIPAILPLEEVRDRYSIGKTALGDRMRHCGIVPKRSGNRSFLNSDQIETLDRLNEHLRSGRGMTDFDSPYAVLVDEPEPTAIVPSRPSAPAQTEVSIPVQGLDALAELERLLSFLDQAVERKWHLPTSVVRHLLGSKPTAPNWRRFGFVFTPAGSHGQETAWQITKDE